MIDTERPQSAYRTRIGHAHIKVRDLNRAVAFYTQFFDLALIERVGNHYAFLSGGDFHHEIALQSLGPHAPQPSARHTGLYHIAFEVPDHRSFALAFQTLMKAGVAVAAVDHVISWAIYFEDPDGNGLEIYWDTRGEPQGQTHWRGINHALSAEQIWAALPVEEQVRN